jgi:hypothetical protein
MELKQTPGSWLADNRILISMLAIGGLLLAVSLQWVRPGRVDIVDATSRANCVSLYQRASTRAESLAVDGQVASVTAERKYGYLRPDTRCREIRAYDSARAH